MIVLMLLFALLPFVSFAQTEVSGEVSGEWTAEDSPYIVVDSTWVPEGEELSIGPGVDVLFGEGLGLTVSGGLIVEGTEDDSVSFLSLEEEELWLGITITDQNFEYSFNYCEMRNNTNAILSGDEVNIYLNNCIIQSENRPINSTEGDGNVFGAHVEINICHITGNNTLSFVEANFYATNSYIRTGSGEEWGIYNNDFFDVTMLDSCIIIGSVDAWMGASFRNCRFLSPNDSVTVFVRPSSVMLGCYIQGRVIIGISGRRITIEDNIIETDLTGRTLQGADIINNYIGGSVEYWYEDSTRFENNQVIGRFRAHNNSDADLYVKECEILNSNHYDYAVELRVYDEIEEVTTIFERCTIYGLLNVYYRGLGNFSFINNTIITQNAEWPSIYLRGGERNYQFINNIIISKEENASVFTFSRDLQDNIPDIRYNCIWGFENILSYYNRRNEFEFDLDESNIIEDPLFDLLAPRFLQLHRDSPCIDSGDPESPLDPDTTRADMGRFYYHHENAVPRFTAPVLSDFELFSAYPNPFNSTLNIDFFNPVRSPITIVLYDINGRELIKEDRQWYNIGRHCFALDGRSLPSGSYFISLKSDKFTRCQKVELIR